MIKPQDGGVYEENMQGENEAKPHQSKNNEDPDNPTLKCEASLDNINSSIIRYDIKEPNYDEGSPKLSAKFLEAKDEERFDRILKLKFA